jgi:hypothetical protein
VQQQRLRAPAVEGTADEQDRTDVGAGGYDYRYAAAEEIGCERWQPIGLVLRPAVFNRNIQPFACVRRSPHQLISGRVQPVP